MKACHVASRWPFRGSIRVPGDKSLSHRALMLAAIAQGKSKIAGLSPARDVKSTLGFVRMLGVKVRRLSGVLEVFGEGFAGLREPEDVVNLGNSGTSMRLGAGIAAACPFLTVLTGDASLRSRPMARVIEPLRRMGANILGRGNARLGPLVIAGGTLKGIEYTLPQASAQVKSAVLLAGLRAHGQTRLKEPIKTRDHTERLLRRQGVELGEADGWLTLDGPREAAGPFVLSVPGDFSSAAFFVVGALLKEGSDLLIEDVGLNPLRTGLLRVLERMGARIEVHVYDEGGEDEEPRGDIRVRHSPLKGVDVSEDELPSLIDEVPALCVAAALARGRTRILGAKELRVKESDRLMAMATGLQGLGVEVEELEDGLVIHGTHKIVLGLADSFLDHRIAMAFAILGSATSDGLHIGRPECVEISYPGFWQDLEKFAKIG